MIRFVWGMFTASLLLLAWHVKGQYVFYDLFKRGDKNEYGDVCKQPTFRQMTGRLGNE